MNEKAIAFHVAGKVNIKNIEIGALYQQSENSDSKVDGGDFKDTTVILSGAINLDRVKLKAQYGQTDLDFVDDKLKLMAVGADYKLAKASKVFAYYSKVESDASVDQGGIEDSTFGVGFEHKFSM